MEEDEAKGKETEDEGVFFWFGDDLAIDDNPHRAVGSRRKTATTRRFVKGSYMEVADGFGKQTRPYSRKKIPHCLDLAVPSLKNRKSPLEIRRGIV